MEFLYLCGIPENTGSEFMGYAEFFEYYSNLLLPFVCAGSIPHLKTKLKNIFFCFGRQTRTVRPQTLILAHRPALR
ncbi:hypothetical protein I4U23_023526 [Adineta vaga]|nr:hypothetical protein I4U23_023526 [Adineta vaga]